jgi:hypothetical protein
MRALNVNYCLITQKQLGKNYFDQRSDGLTKAHEDITSLE